MEKFAGYGFPKAHSAAYAFLAFVTAYLKTHYPIEFMSALLTSESGNTAKVVRYINECREMGIAVLPPDVNSSEFTFTPDRRSDSLRPGRDQERRHRTRWNRSSKARAEGGAFTSLYDFCERVDLSAVNRRMIESFIKAGALDSLGGTARAVVRRDRRRHGNRRARVEGSSQRPIRPVRRSGGARTRGGASAARQFPIGRRRRSSTGEKEMLGFYITGHPLDQHMDKVASSPRTSPRAWKACRRTPKSPCAAFSPASSASATRKASCGRLLQIEDQEGSVEAMVFSTQYDRLLPVLNEDKAVLVRGLVLPEENAPPKISVQDIVLLENARVRLPSLISIRVPVNGAVAKRTGPIASASIVRPQARQAPKFGCVLKRAATSRLSWMYRPRSVRTRNSAPSWPVSADRKRWRSWPTNECPASRAARRTHG